MTTHGGNLRALAHRAGLHEEDILDFSASINPLGPPDCLRAVLARNIDCLVHYPDPDCTELVEAIARRYAIHSERIVAGNGSTELLYAAVQACQPRRAVVPIPSYADYTTAAQMAGVPVEHVVLSPDNDWTLDFSSLTWKLTAGDLVILGQPNNPTGQLFDRDEFLALAAVQPEVTFLVDEAFAEFVAGYRSPADDMPENVVVLRSMTKFFAIPGLRLGWAAARPNLAERLRHRVLPWSVGTLAQAAGVAVLADMEYAHRTVELLTQQRQRLVEGLSSLPVEIYPSAANYLLVRLTREDLDAATLADRLIRRGIAIRTFDSGEPLQARCFRVAVRTSEENERLLEALRREILGLTPQARQEASGRHESAEGSGDIAGLTRFLHPTRYKKTPAIMFQGTSSNAGKSLLTAALCRILLQDGVRVAPFKSQNMSLNSFVTRDGGEMGRAQVVQAQACRLEPDVRMNPILLKPNSDTGSQVIVRGKPIGNMRVGQYVDYKREVWADACDCYDSLAAEFDAMVLEGAGSPGEVNLKSHDIVNMRMAQYAQAPVLVVGDIDRGGVFASFVGTMEVLSPWERKLVAGWVVNRFRGDASLLAPAHEYTLAHTGRPVLGVVPYLASLNLPEEDSVEFKSRSGRGESDCSAHDTVEIALVDLPHLSNFTDFDAFQTEPDVRLRVIRSAGELGSPDAVLLGGSKNTLGDLAYLRLSGLAARIEQLARQGATEIVGICGGFQMLGLEMGDPLQIESPAGISPGLGLLPVRTVLAAEKTLTRTTARHHGSGLEVSGYEIHHGQTQATGGTPVLTRSDGAVLGIAAADGRLWGTYLHGVFDADAFRRWFIDCLRVRRGLPPLGQVVSRYDIEPALDRLAEVVRQSLPIGQIYRWMGLELDAACATTCRRRARPAGGRPPLAATPGARIGLAG